MKPRHATFALVMIASLGQPAAPAQASAQATIVAIGGSATMGGVTVGDDKRIRQQEAEQQARRLALYRTWYYRKYGSYPTSQQFREWYLRTYGVYPL